MALSNLTLLSQIAGYVIALILSVCMTVPLSMHQDEFRGHCLLFSTGIWQEDDGQFSVDWASQAYCNYGIFVGVTLFVTSAIQIYRLSMFMYKGIDRCEVAAGKAIDKKDHIDTTGFHIEMGTAQFGAWASWACWVGLAVLALLKMCRYHQIENMRVSMFRERQRLVNENAATLDRTDDNGSKPSTLSRA
ncbi:transmembrane protein 179 isoform X2 [Schistocerca serialis cubense]|uniref:transmembrane protein 179 isoform X2 n=1 Tax=Schistocerca serialis cubense TaxID=2023355 RepID=UPI00214F3AEF|nr:transmembrane protein 179 isoform X2 [Schistocerca serialis cubense]